MKQKLLGILIMAVGCAMLAVSTALIVDAANEKTPSQSDSVQEAAITEGAYSAADGDVLSVLGSEITIDGETMSFSLSVWRNIPLTDENTGKITYLNYYYIRTENAQFTYDPTSDSITAFGTVYTKI